MGSRLSCFIGVMAIGAGIICVIRLHFSSGRKEMSSKIYLVVHQMSYKTKGMRDCSRRDSIHTVGKLETTLSSLPFWTCCRAPNEIQLIRESYCVYDYPLPALIEVFIIFIIYDFLFIFCAVISSECLTNVFSCQDFRMVWWVLQWLSCEVKWAKTKTLLWCNSVKSWRSPGGFTYTDTELKSFQRPCSTFLSMLRDGSNFFPWPTEITKITFKVRKPFPRLNYLEFQKGHSRAVR